MKRYKSVKEGILNPLNGMSQAKTVLDYIPDLHPNLVKEIIAEPELAGKYHLIAQHSIDLGYAPKSPDEASFVKGLAHMLKVKGDAVPVKNAFLTDYYIEVYGDAVDPKFLDIVRQTKSGI